jgi:maltokinase
MSSPAPGWFGGALHALSAEEFLPALSQFLASQPWFAPSSLGSVPFPLPSARLEDLEVLFEGDPGLVRLEVAMAGDTYQVPVGLRPEPGAAALRLRETSVIGQLESGGQVVVAYDAVVDPELAIELLALATGGRVRAGRVRRIGVEKSNSSLVYDDTWIFKLFRRLYPGRNPEVELVSALDRVGFNHITTPIAIWRSDRRDLGIVREFLAGGATGWSLALASLRDLYDRGGPPELAGGDFGAEARRLGTMTARLHVALAEAFGTHPGDPASWARLAASRLEEAGGDELPDASDLLGSVAESTDAGASIRVHGDYHLGRVMRVEFGWYVVDLEGEPFRPFEERRPVQSPLRDVAGMLRSFHYASSFAARERSPHERQNLAGLPEAWERRNREAFLEGYLGTPGVGALLPSQPSSFDLVLAVFELDKAAQELAFERVFRPWRAQVPRRALERLLAGPSY